MSSKTIDWRDSASAVIGSGCCVYVGMPCDVIKLRLQTTGAGERAYRGFLHCGATILRKEGVRAFWKGSVPAWSGALMENVALFTANGAFQRLLLGDQAAAGAQLPKWQYYLCGGLSGVVSSVSLCPMEVMKVKLQFQIGRSTYRGPLDCLLQTVRTEGVRGLYAGLLPLMSRDLPFNTIFLGSYGALCQLFAQRRHCAVDDLPLAYNSLAGGMAGFVGWAAVFPIDVVKSRVQAAPPGHTVDLRALVSSIYNSHGFRGFYRGVSAALIRSVPANAALFTGVEWSKSILAEM